MFRRSCGVAIAVPAAASAPVAPAQVVPETAPSSGSDTLNTDALSNLYHETSGSMSGMSPAWRRALVVGAIILILNIIWFGTRLYLIGVRINSAFVESNIESSHADKGMSVTVVCPDQFIARPGESHDSKVSESLLGLEVMASVTVSNTNGDFSWIAQ
jgi:hypothetical protein